MKDKEMKNLTDASRKILQWIRFCALDSDGIIFPNNVWEGVTLPLWNGKELTPFHFKPKLRTYYDGQGISLLRAVGIRVCVITNEKGDNAAGIRGLVQKLNDLPSAKKPIAEGGWHPVQLFEGSGGPKKLETLKGWLKEYGGTLEECAAMGDDLVDVQMLQAVAFAAAPASAEESIRDICQFVSERKGGEGAVRDFANLVLKVRKIDPFTLPPG